jgi:N-acetyl-beta-hexosaminidase
VLKDVLNETDLIFDDDYIHFGGDEIEEECWEKS